MLESLASWIIHVISVLGYPGIVLTMGIESALIPLPSEIIMPFSGYLASTGRFNLWLVILMGAIGNTLGSLVAYWLGYAGREKVVRRLIRRYGKYVLFTEDELDKTEKWMHKYHGVSVFIARFTPGIRTVISLPAGIVRLPLKKFIPLTFVGTLLWSGVLAYIGYILGQSWEHIGGYFHRFNEIIIAVIVLAVGIYVYRKLRS